MNLKLQSWQIVGTSTKYLISQTMAFTPYMTSTFPGMAMIHT